MPKRKSLKVIVDIECHAVTCPGVFLPEREDVFINIEIFGQLKRTQLNPPVFPFLFHEKIRFEKVFLRAADPIQIAEELCGETVQIELVQLSYPAGEKLGVFVDNAREFLFPTPKVTPTYPGVDRELLFERSPTFPGIAPKLEFSSRTTIKEVTSLGRSQSEKDVRERSKTHPECVESKTNNSKSRSEKMIPKSPQKSRSRKKSATKSQSPTRRGRGSRRSRSANRGCTMYGYEQPTIASRARSPSPYARRRMAELSIRDPFESAANAKPFRSEIDKKPEFVIRKVNEDNLSLERTPPPPKSPGRSTTPVRRSKSPYGSPSGAKSGYKLHLSNSSDADSSSAMSSFSNDLAAYRFATRQAMHYPKRKYQSHRRSKSPAMSPRDAYFRAIRSPRCQAESVSEPVTRCSTPVPKNDAVSATCSDKGADIELVNLDSDTSDVHTSMKAGSPTSGRPSAASHSPSRLRDSKFSVDDLDDAGSYVRQTLQERLASRSSPYEKIRDRVRALLQSPRANIIADNAKQEGEERYWRRRSRSPSPRSPRVSVRLNDCEYWNEMASVYKGKPHRAVFDENLDKIYDDIYHKLKNDKPAKK